MLSCLIIAPQSRPTGEQISQIVALQFRPRHRTKLHSTKPIERLNGEIKWRMTEVVGILPNEDAIVGLVGANQLAERRMDRPARPLQDTRNHRAVER